MRSKVWWNEMQRNEIRRDEENSEEPRVHQQGKATTAAMGFGRSRKVEKYDYTKTRTTWLAAHAPVAVIATVPEHELRYGHPCLNT